MEKKEKKFIYNPTVVRNSVLQKFTYDQQVQKEATDQSEINSVV